MSREEIHRIRKEYLASIFGCETTKRIKREKVIRLLQDLNMLISQILERGGKATKEKELLLEMVDWLKMNRIHNPRKRKEVVVLNNVGFTDQICQ